MQLVPTGETTGWFDPARDGGFVRRAQASYLADTGDAYVPPHLVRQHNLRKSDEITGTTGRDPRVPVRVHVWHDPALAERPEAVYAQ